jgi:hypothetical protein
MEDMVSDCPEQIHSEVDLEVSMERRPLTSFVTGWLGLGTSLGWV